MIDSGMLVLNEIFNSSFPFRVTVYISTSEHKATINHSEKIKEYQVNLSPFTFPASGCFTVLSSETPTDSHVWSAKYF